MSDQAALAAFKNVHPYPDESGYRTLFKFTSISKDKENVKYIESLFIDQRLYHSLPESFNDPFEGKPHFVLDGKRNSAKKIRCHLIRETRLRQGLTSKKAEALINNAMKDPNYITNAVQNAQRVTFEALRITCFTTGKENLLFWSHYANSHKGFCIGFDSTKHPISMAYKVEYSDVYPQVEYPIPRDMRAFKPALVKSLEWQYEDEFRTIFIPGISPELKDDGQSLPLDTSVITDIYLGAKMSNEDKCILLEIIDRSGFNPQIWQASLSNSSFKLSFSKLD
ncbi:DUF2971 domain-containing protein [Vibrio splendidus]